MRKNAQRVLQAFMAGEPCNEKTISTDGRTLWSYSTPIAYKILSLDKPGQWILHAFAGKISATTNSQLAALRHFHGDFALVVKYDTITELRAFIESPSTSDQHKVAADFAEQHERSSDSQVWR